MSASELFSVEGKRVIVTGGTSGIGLMIALAFVENGASVLISSRKAEACASVAEELSRVGECVAVPEDLSSEEGCRRLADAVEERWEALDVLVNNAGATWGAPLEDHDSRAWDRVLDLNVQGVFHLTRFLRPLLDASVGGEPPYADPARVINVGSIDGLRVSGMETYSYSASKAGVHHLTRHLAWDLSPRITVNAIAPGPFQSRMMAATLEAQGEWIAQRAPMRRIGSQEDMAGVSLYLASRAASYVTGAVIPVDGGLSTCLASWSNAP
jgi:NAD(P)-dependent dehydrogenase (short-subunit alcohol dehydrogenase family)